MFPTPHIIKDENHEGHFRIAGLVGPFDRAQLGELLKESFDLYFGRLSTADRIRNINDYIGKTAGRPIPESPG